MDIKVNKYKCLSLSAAAKLLENVPTINVASRKVRDFARVLSLIAYVKMQVKICMMHHIAAHCLLQLPSAGMSTSVLV